VDAIQSAKENRFGGSVAFRGNIFRPFHYITADGEEADPANPDIFFQKIEKSLCPSIAGFSAQSFLLKSIVEFGPCQRGANWWFDRGRDFFSKSLGV
jgi:hypothetical protein